MFDLFVLIEFSSLFFHFSFVRRLFIHSRGVVRMNVNWSLYYSTLCSFIFRFRAFWGILLLFMLLVFLYPFGLWTYIYFWLKFPSLHAEVLGCGAKRLAWALFVLLLPILVCCQPTELILGLFFCFICFPILPHTTPIFFGDFLHSRPRRLHLPRQLQGFGCPDQGQGLPPSQVRWGAQHQTRASSRFCRSCRRGEVLFRASLRSEKDRSNIDIYRGFIEKFGLFGTVVKPLHKKQRCVFVLHTREPSS